MVSPWRHPSILSMPSCNFHGSDQLTIFQLHSVSATKLKWPHLPAEGEHFARLNSSSQATRAFFVSSESTSSRTHLPSLLSASTKLQSMFRAKPQRPMRIFCINKCCWSRAPDHVVESLLQVQTVGNKLEVLTAPKCFSSMNLRVEG